MGVFFTGAGLLGVAKVVRVMKKDVKIAGLMYVKLEREVWPHPVIHPDPRDMVAVSDELARLRSDDRGVGAVHTNAVEIVDQERFGFRGGA